MKKLYLFKVVCLIFFSQIFLSGTVRASHAAGAELLYEWVGESTYRLIFKFYRDCGGVAAPRSVWVCYYSECRNVMEQVELHILPDPNGIEIGTGCPGYPTRCTGGSLPGYQEYIYEGLVGLTERCSTWRFFIGISARNSAIRNLNTGFGMNLYVEATLNNEYAPDNSSPSFTINPLPYVCINSPYTYNNGAIDKDGDLIRYENLQPRTGLEIKEGACGSVPPVAPVMPYLPGYSLPSNPFATNNSYMLDTVTGHISFRPVAAQTAAVSIRVKEFRNGVEIGSVMRDIQVVVRSDCYNSPIIGLPDSASLINGRLTDDRVEGCANTELSFCVDLTAPMDPNAVLVSRDNHAASLPGSSVTYTDQQTNAVRGCVRWTPTLRDTGLHILLFTIKDSTCRPPGVLTSQIFTIPVYIWPPVSAWKDTVVCPDDPVQLHVLSGWPSFSWNVLSGGAGLNSLSCRHCPDPVVRADRTTSYVATSDNGICSKSSDTVVVTVLPAPEINAMQDTLICVNQPFRLNVDITRQPGLSYDVLWTPGIYLDSATVANPVTTTPHDITYHVTVTGNGMPCVSRDSVRVSVLKGFELHTPDTAICKGETVIPHITGDSRYSYRWRPSEGVSDTTVMTPSITPDTGRSYSVTAMYAGCRDSIGSFFIDVQPVPVVNGGGDRVVCYGDTLPMHVSVTPSGYPYYTYTWNPAGSLDNPAAVNPLFEARKTTTLTVVVSTPAGCSGSDDILVQVAEMDFIRVSPDTGICPGDTIQLHVWGSQVSQVWRPADFINDTLASDPFVYPLTSGVYTVYARNADNCLDTQSVRVHVYPQAVVALPDSARIYPGESYQMAPGGNCLYFEWFPPLGLTDHRIANPVAAPEVNTRYFVNARTEHGCAATDSVDLYINLDSYIDMPNAFVPGSGPNGILKPVRRGNVALKNFSVFNRWGMKIFETSTLDAGWDGHYQGVPQPQGVYVYMVEAVTPAGRLFYKQGNITLLR